MRITSFLLSIFCIACPTICFGLTQQAILEEGTPIRIKLEEEVSTKISTPGQKVQLVVIDDILAKDGKTILVKDGSPAIGYLNNIDEKDGGKGGKLTVEITSVKAVDGTKIPLRGLQTKSGRNGIGLGGCAIGLVLAGPIGLGVAALYGQGKHAKIPEGTIFTVFVDRDSTVAPIQSKQSDDLESFHGEKSSEKVDAAVASNQSKNVFDSSNSQKNKDSEQK